MRRVLRVVLPLGFVAVTAWTVVDLVAQGAPPPPGAAAEAPEPTGVRIAVAADIGSDERGQATLQAMAEARPDLHLALGDLSYAGPGSEQAWCDLVRTTVGPLVPFEVLAGNHEEDTGEDGRLRAFTACLPDRLDAAGTYGTEYYFDIGDLARIILISPDLTVDGRHYYYGEGNEHERWLTAAIDSAREQGIGWVVVGMHKNCLSTGEYYCNAYQDLLDLLVEKRVDLVLHGHDHSYQRSKQLQAPRTGCPQVVVDAYDPDCVVDDGADAEHSRGEGPVFVVAGMGGGELYELHPDDPEAGYFARSMGRGKGGRHGFVTLRLEPEALTVEFAPSSPGSFTDSFRISGPPAPLSGPACTDTGWVSRTSARAVVVTPDPLTQDVVRCAARQLRWTTTAKEPSAAAEVAGASDIAVVVSGEGAPAAEVAAATVRQLRAADDDLRLVLVAPLGRDGSEQRPARDLLRAVAEETGADFVDPVGSRWLAAPTVTVDGALTARAVSELGDRLARAVLRAEIVRDHMRR